MRDSFTQHYRQPLSPESESPASNRTIVYVNNHKQPHFVAGLITVIHLTAKFSRIFRALSIMSMSRAIETTATVCEEGPTAESNYRTV
jgi:hypothetical protein